MRKILMGMLLSWTVLNICAQPNNPQNKTGQDFLISVALIKKDNAAGKLKTYDQKTFDSYAAKIPVTAKLNVDLAADVYKKVKDPHFNTAAYIASAPISPVLKGFFTEVNTASQQSSPEALKAYLTAMVNRVTSSRVTLAEKEQQLQYISILYNVTDEAARNNGGNGPETGQETGYVEFSCSSHPGTCGAVIGMVAGNIICGPPCAIGGAVIGSIVGTVIGAFK